MQYKSNIKSKLVYCLGTAILMAPLSILAKEVNMYDQPNTGSKVVSKVDLAEGIIPIFTQKSGDWMKVGDPQNGNTGWVKTADVQNSSGSRVSFSQQIMSEGAPQSYQVFQFGGDQKPMTAQQQKKFIKDMEKRQVAMQQTIQREMEEMNRHFAAMQQFAWPNMTDDEPMGMPVEFVPVQKDGAVKEARMKTDANKVAVVNKTENVKS